MENYQQYRPQMRSGDIIAFSGKGRVSEIIKWKTGSPYSHVGIVLEADMQGAMGQSILMIESTSLNNLPDAVTGEFIKGVQMHFLSHRLQSYDGSAWWVPLRKGLSKGAEFNMQKWLRGKHHERTTYDSFQAIGAGVDLFDWFPGLENERDFSSLFCSELVVKALQIAGIIDCHINPSEQTPADVVKMDCFCQAMRI